MFPVCSMMQIWNPVGSLVPCVLNDADLESSVPCVLNDADLESSGFTSSLCAQCCRAGIHSLLNGAELRVM